MSNIDRRLPLIDLHRHLDGNVRLETILEVGQRYGLELPASDVEGLRSHVQVTEPQPGVMAFIRKFYWMTRIMLNYEVCWRIAYENVQDAKAQGLDYVELRFSPLFMSQAHDLDPNGVVEAVCDGVAQGRRDFEMRVGLIGILSRTYGPEMCWTELKALMSKPEQIIALDLAGDEARFPPELFVDHFRAAKELGWKITVHAGESAGSASIWKSIELLGAQRIGHAVSALDDGRLIEKMRMERIAIECNLTSNVQTSTVSSYADHPLKRFMMENLIATINTDDPGISGIDLAYEYEIAAPAAGLDRSQIRQLQINALEAAFLSEEEREIILQAAAQRP